MISNYKNLVDTLEAQIIILRSKQKALRDYPYNKDYSLEARVIDVTIKNILLEIHRVEDL